MKRLHIVGCPRSGTTLLLELVATCFSNDGFCAHEMSIFEVPDARGELYISKQPNDIRHLQHIFPGDPSLFVIYLGRDPRAVITSTHGSSPGQYFCNYRIWRECYRAAQRYQGHKRFLSLRYEDLVTDPDREQAAIRAHFPFLEQRHYFSEYHLYASPSAAAQQAMRGLRQVNRESLDKWRGHLPRVAEQLRRHPALSQDLVSLGYEADEHWMQQLAGVDCIVYPCRYPERRPHLKEWEKGLRVYLKSRRYLKRMKR